MAENYDVVIFFGPPFAGKSAFYKHHLNSSHQRISATELFRQNPEFGLRQIILKIASFLRDGKKVVIDDENWTKATRVSYTKALSSKFPAFKFLCLKFKPQGLTPYWSMEWALAEKVLQHDFSQMPFDLKRAEAKINHWFGKDYYKGLKFEEPGKDEGLDLKVVETKLTAEVQYKFEVPALFIQWQAFAVTSSNDDNDVLECHTGMADVINCWLKANPWGRIIIIMDGVGRCEKDSDSSSEPSPDSGVIKTLLHSLCKVVPIPIYTIQLQSHTRNFCCPPQAGILAFLQRLHHLHLFHRHTLYLHCTLDHCNMASEAGVRYATAKNILANPQMVMCATKVAVKPELQDMNLKQIGGLRSLPIIPLFNEAKDSFVDGDLGHFEEPLPWKYMHGVYFKDSETLERYQQLYADTASHLSDSGSKMTQHQHSSTDKSDQPRPAASQVPASNAAIHVDDTHRPTTQGLRSSSRATRELPSWLLSKSQRKKQPSDECVIPSAQSLVEDSSVEDEVLAVKGKKKTITQHSTVYCMNVLELLETAQLFLKESGESAASISSLMNSSSNPRTKKSCHTDAVNTTEDEARQAEEPHHPVAVKTNHTSNRNETNDSDFFLSPEDITPGRPPPKKWSQLPSANAESITNLTNEEDQSASVTPNKLHKQLKNMVPETITTIPETEGFQSNASAIKQKKTEEKSGPDLSFLDDIF